MDEKNTRINTPAQAHTSLQVITDDELAACSGGADTHPGQAAPEPIAVGGNGASPTPVGPIA